MGTPPAHDLMQKIIEEVHKKRLEMIETMVIPFLQHTGLKPDEIELVEREETATGGSKTVWYFRKKGSIAQATRTRKPDPELTENKERVMSEAATNAEIENLKIGSNLSRDAILRLEKQIERLNACIDTADAYIAEVTCADAMDEIGRLREEIERLKSECDGERKAKELSLAGLESVTELHSATKHEHREALAEVERLKARVDELECTLDDEEASGLESVDVINKLKADRAALVEALRPFSVCAWVFDDKDDDWPVTVRLGEMSPAEKMSHHARIAGPKDFRRAANAIAQHGGIQ